MNLLLDTHVFIWAAQAPQLLSSKVQKVLLDETNTIFISAVTPWELSIKFHAGKLPEAEVIIADTQTAIESLDATILPIEVKHGVLAGAIKWEHRDPFDRMLAAQSLIEGLTLISKDSQFDNIAGFRRLW